HSGGRDHHQDRVRVRAQTRVGGVATPRLVGDWAFPVIGMTYFGFKLMLKLQRKYSRLFATCAEPVSIAAFAVAADRGGGTGIREVSTPGALLRLPSSSGSSECHGRFRVLAGLSLRAPMFRAS